MLTDNEVLMARARQTLAARGNGPLATFLYLLVRGVPGIIPYLGALVVMIISGPMMLGYIAFLAAYPDRVAQQKFETLFSGFNNFGNAFVLELLTGLFTVLWMLLLVVPGIVANYSYAMAYFIMNDNPGISGMEAIRRSKRMMCGNRWKLFCLELRFLGWGLLCIVTLNIASIWVTPYIYTSRLHFYRDLLNQENPTPSGQYSAPAPVDQHGAPVPLDQYAMPAEAAPSKQSL